MPFPHWGKTQSFPEASADTAGWQARSAEFKQLEAHFTRGEASENLQDSTEQTMDTFGNTMRQLPATGFSDTLPEGAIRMTQNALQQDQQGIQTRRDPAGAAADNQNDFFEQRTALRALADRLGLSDRYGRFDRRGRFARSEEIQAGSKAMADQMREQLMQQLQNKRQDTYGMLSTMMKNFAEMEQTPIQNLR